jgi:hypothetical protein
MNLELESEFKECYAKTQEKIKPLLDKISSALSEIEEIALNDEMIVCLDLKIIKNNTLNNEALYFLPNSFMEKWIDLFYNDDYDPRKHIDKKFFEDLYLPSQIDEWMNSTCNW